MLRSLRTHEPRWRGCMPNRAGAPLLHHHLRTAHLPERPLLLLTLLAPLEQFFLERLPVRTVGGPELAFFFAQGFFRCRQT